VTLTADGPSSACAGANLEIIFRFNVDLTRVNGLGTFVVVQPKNTWFVSMEPLHGTTGQVGHTNPDPSIAEHHSFSSSGSAEGAVRLVLRTSPDFTGEVEAIAWIPGTGTASSNRVTTAITDCPESLPRTGLGTVDHSRKPKFLVSVLLFLAGALSIACSSRVKDCAGCG
jgi:hypothetical protein